MIDENYHWYPIYTRSRAEKKTLEDLLNKGVEAYLPLKKTLKIWSDRKKWITEPLLKSYIFAKISAKEYPVVVSSPGFARFIYFSGKIASMPDQQIEDLKLLLSNEQDLDIIEQELSVGESVIIKAGPLKGLIAELVTINSKKNIVLRLKNLGYSINIKTSMAYIEPLKD